MSTMMIQSIPLPINLFLHLFFRVELMSFRNSPPVGDFRASSAPTVQAGMSLVLAHDIDGERFAEGG